MHIIFACAAAPQLHELRCKASLSVGSFVNSLKMGTCARHRVGRGAQSMKQGTTIITVTSSGVIVTSAHDPGKSPTDQEMARSVVYERR